VVDSPGDRPRGGGQVPDDPHPGSRGREAQQDRPAERKVTSELGHDPTAEEIAELTGIDSDEVESIKRSAQIPVSLEKPVGEEEESELGDFIADERAESPYDHAADILTQDALRRALDRLSYRERRVLELRYGLGGEQPRTLDEVGRTFNVTRERIRQIENHSFKKLHRLPELQTLREPARSTPTAIANGKPAVPARESTTSK
jgi:RNA polymerase primary sigma factor